jgi:anti-anti-sigma factor
MKTSFQTSKEANTLSLHIEGDLTIRSSADLQENLLNLANKIPVRLSLKNVSAIDVTAIQLLYAFRKANSSTDIMIAGPENEAVLNLLSRTGLLKLLQ